MEKLYRHVFFNGLPLDPPSEPDPQPKPGYMASLRSPEIDLVNAALDILADANDRQSTVLTTQRRGNTMKLNELREIAPEIAAHIEATYHNDAVLLDVPSPHHLAHQVADRWPGLGAAFYRLVADAARECLIGAALPEPSGLPRVSSEMSEELGDAFGELAVTIGQLRVWAERRYNATGDYLLIRLCNELSRISWRLYRICM